MKKIGVWEITMSGILPLSAWPVPQHYGGLYDLSQAAPLPPTSSPLSFHGRTATQVKPVYTGAHATSFPSAFASEPWLSWGSVIYLSGHKIWPQDNNLNNTGLELILNQLCHTENHARHCVNPFKAVITLWLNITAVCIHVNLFIFIDSPRNSGKISLCW